VAPVPVRFPNHDEGATGPLQLGTGDGSSQQGPVYTASSYATAYDPFGNRQLQSFQTAACSTSYTPTVTYNSNNQVTKAPSSVSGFTYDAAGNVLNDGLNQYAYDGEGRLCAVKNSVSSYVQYVYDASGTRVAKGSISSMPSSGATCAAPVSVPATGYTFTPTALYLLDQGGDQVTELNTKTGPMLWAHSNVWPGGHLDATYDTLGLHFHIADPLGSRRIQTNAAGTVEESYLSLPFGDGLTPVPNPNCLPANNCYSEDPTENHFTGKERDTESGNDYFGARYYASSMGRFMSPDKAVDQHPANPQSWNLYSYVRNNPLSLVDPSGNYVCNDTTMSSADCDMFENYLNRLRDQAEHVADAKGYGSEEYQDLQRSIDAYGGEGEANGVTVAVNATGGYAGTTDSGSGNMGFSISNPTGQDTLVTLNSGDWGKAKGGGDLRGLLATIAHEGSHVADRTDWAWAGSTDGASPSHFATEYRAYGVTTTVWESFGAKTLSGTRPDGKAFGLGAWWVSGANSDDNNFRRATMVKELYTDWDTQAFSKNTNGGGK
jgi:RHS repeat-associated protein